VNLANSLDSKVDQPLAKASGIIDALNSVFHALDVSTRFQRERPIPDSL
jgi:hypothetical protein